jgi:hypothetical protein
MHLDYTRSSHKGKTYTSYRISQSVRKGKKVTKKVLFSLGQLTPLQVKQIRLILHSLKKPDDVLVALNEVIPTKTLRYLELAVANYYWNYWQLDLAFDHNTDSMLPTKSIARILTLNRCTDPHSHYSIPRWIKRTALPEMLSIDTNKLNDDKIYYELDNIEQNKSHIENHIMKVTKNENPRSYDFVNYDLSSAYFVGIRCTLSKFGKGKDNQPYQQQVVLAILVNSEGYPFKWDVFPGNKAEVHTLKENVDACKKLELDSVTMVFDRGLMSQKNLAMLEESEGVKFISALDKSQIPTSPGVDLKQFSSLREKNIEAQIRSLTGFHKFEANVFFKDLGEIEGKRYVLSINTNLLREERKMRRKKLRQFNSFLKKFNEELKNAKRDRDYGVTNRKISEMLKKLKINRFYEDPVVKPITVKRKLKNGNTKSVSSFKVTLKRIDEAIAKAKLLDGVCVLL